MREPSPCIAHLKPCGLFPAAARRWQDRPVVAFSITAVAIAVGAVAVAVTRRPPLGRVVRSSRWVIGGRVVMILIVLASLPNLLSNLVDILAQ